MAAQVALKRQQAAEDAIALGLRAAASEGGIPIMTAGPLWGPGTVSPPDDVRNGDDTTDEKDTDRSDNISIGSDEDRPPSSHVSSRDEGTPSPVSPQKEDAKHIQWQDSIDKASMPTAFRPGRLNGLEILERVFPFQRKSVLELVLQGCNGDVVKAIEQFLCAQDTVTAAAQQQRCSNQSHDDFRFHPYMTSAQWNSTVKSSSGTPKQAMFKSAFTPLGTTSSLSSLHSAFPSHFTPFSTLESLRSQSIPGPYTNSDLPLTQTSYPGLTGLTSPFHSFLSSPFSMYSYKPQLYDSMNLFKAKSDGVRHISENNKLGESWKEISGDKIELDK
ncbi:hypothetical protein CHS0354_006998 [Potamilus streckersoni]|uniref:DMA domain-containing protein n=1 Tax=Potamilus streckersoni TaxID=2493646 RepID=A0AAE0RWJ4_9BIVA|nr:hypothetical protein CHS0354_006998 [Potamilus streckersoni]